MKTFEFQSQLWLPRTTGEVFPFFADAFNLEEITPPWLQCRVISPIPIRMGTGTEIDYRLKIRGIPIRWRSRITVWDPPFRFVDEQVLGPYRLWVHEHRVAESAGGTLCQDHVQHAAYGGAIVNKLFVARDIRDIFLYRSVRLQEIFQTLPMEECQQTAGMRITAGMNPSEELLTPQRARKLELATSRV